VIDHTNLSEWEYVRFVKKAQQEHYFVSIVTMPPPEELQTVRERSQFDVNDDELTQMLAKWEPYSPNKLIDKSVKMQEEGHYAGFHHMPLHKMSSGDLTNTKRGSFAATADIITEIPQE
jgi:hypothetical protein